MVVHVYLKRLWNDRREQTIMHLYLFLSPRLLHLSTLVFCCVSSVMMFLTVSMVTMFSMRAITSFSVYIFVSFFAITSFFVYLFVGFFAITSFFVFLFVSFSVYSRVTTQESEPFLKTRVVRGRFTTIILEFTLLMPVFTALLCLKQDKFTIHCT